MTAVTDNQGLQRFELEVDGLLVFANYRRRAGIVVVPHVEAAPALRGTGAAQRFMEGMLALLRDRGEKIEPICSYAAAYIRRHPEHQDLLVRA